MTRGAHTKHILYRPCQLSPDATATQKPSSVLGVWSWPACHPQNSAGRGAAFSRSRREVCSPNPDAHPPTVAHRCGPGRPPPPAKSHAWRAHLRGSPLPLARRPAQVGRGDLARAERARQPHLEQRVRAAGTRDGVPAPGGPNGMGNLGPAPQVPPQPYRGPHAPLRPSGQPRASGWAPSGHGWPCGAHG